MAYIRMKKSLWEQHRNCEVYVDRRYRSKADRAAGPISGAVILGISRPALMCRRHGQWLKWLSWEDAEKFEQLGARR